MHYAWPGNVRELENAIERAVVICQGDQLRAQDFSSAIAPSALPGRELPPVPGSTLSELERYAILRTLEHCGGATSRAAEILGISPRKIQYKLHEYSATNAARAAAAPPSSNDH